MGAYIRSMPAGMFFLILALAIGAAVALFMIGRQARRRAALVQAMPTTSIGMAVNGYGEFEGRTEAVDGPPLMAPLTGQPCAWYHAQVRKAARTRQQGSDGWTTIYEATSTAPFLLRDGTGVCAVHPYGAEVTPTDKSVWYGSTPIPSDRNPAKIGPTESAEGIVTVQGTSDTTYRYFEERIYLGDPLLVLGQFVASQDEDHEDEDLEEEADDADLEDADDGDDQDDDDYQASDQAVLGRRFDDDKLVADLYTRVGKAAPGWISGGAKTSPFIVTTSLQAVHIAQSDMGGQAAMQVAFGPLAIAALLLYARFG